MSLALSSYGYMGSFWPAQVDVLDLITVEKIIKAIGLLSIFIKMQNTLVDQSSI